LERSVAQLGDGVREHQRDRGASDLAASVFEYGGERVSELANVGRRICWPVRGLRHRVLLMSLTVARLMAAKGHSTREIAKITGWGFNTIARDLRVPNDTESVPNGTARPSLTGGREASRAEIAAKGR